MFRSREHQSIITVKQAVDLGAVAAQLSWFGRTRSIATLRRLRDLYELATPAIYLQVTARGEPCRIVLVPWERQPVSVSGRGWHLVAGAEAMSGLDASSVRNGLSRLPRFSWLFGCAPDHPLFAVSIAQPGQREFHCHFPPNVTHVTIVADGELVVSACQLSHETARVFRVGHAA